MTQTIVENLKNKIAELESTVSIDEWKKTSGLEERFKNLRKTLSQTEESFEEEHICCCCKAGAI